MEYRTLGKTGLRVSAFGIGTWQFGGPVAIQGKADGFPDPGEHATIDLIQRVGERGVNLIDTAPMYGLGEGERRVGRAIAGRRDQWIVATKFGVAPHRREGKRVRLDAIRLQLEASLQRLRTDYVDLYQYHCPPDPALVPVVHEALEELKQAGKIRFHGISTQDSRSLQVLLRHGTDFALLAQSMLTHPAESLRLATKNDLGILVRGVMEWGRLSGRYFDGNAWFAAEDIRSDAFEFEDLARYACLQDLCPEGVAMATFAIRYVLDYPSSHCIVLGGKSIEQYEEAFAALDLDPLDAETTSEITNLRGQLTKRGLWQRALRVAKSLLPER